MKAPKRKGKEYELFSTLRKKVCADKAHGNGVFLLQLPKLQTYDFKEKYLLKELKS